MFPTDALGNLPAKTIQIPPAGRSDLSDGESVVIAGKSYRLGRSIREWTRRKTTDDREGHTARPLLFAAEARGSFASLRTVLGTGTGYAKWSNSYKGEGEK